MEPKILHVTFGHLWKCIRTKLSSGYQLKLIDLKCMFFAKPDEQIAATSCLIFFGPLTRTPMLDPSLSESISARIKLLWLINLMCGWCLELLLNSTFGVVQLIGKKLCCDVQKSRQVVCISNFRKLLGKSSKISIYLSFCLLYNDRKTKIYVTPTFCPC